MDQEVGQVPEEYKDRLRKKFELAAEKGKWLTAGGKIVIEIHKPKPGELRVVKATVILENISHI